MTFFNFSPGSGTQPGAWVVSPQIWVYFVVAVPLTLLTIAAWILWQRWQRVKREGKKMFHNYWDRSVDNLDLGRSGLVSVT